jgi:hypothetical protein
MTACVPAGADKRLVELEDTPAPTDAGVVVKRDAGPPVRPPPPPPRDGGIARDGGPRDGGDLCLEQPTKPPPTQNVFYGTATPTHVALTAGQQMAIGTFGGCSGVLITPTWVLTAEHCGLRSSTRYCIGTDPDDPNVCIAASRVVDNPSADMTLVELSRDARDLLPAVEPVPLFTGTLDNSWLGTTAEASGYGQQETGRSGQREFTAQPIVSVQGNYVTIDGQGQRGVCFGDSGGPLMVIAPDGTTRVIGDLSHGDSSCVGQDNYTRVDRHLAWIEGYVGPTAPPGPLPCDNVDTVGSCDAAYSVATFCENDELQVDTCGADAVCAWSGIGWRCLDVATDPCGGVLPIGSCDGHRLSWCDQGELRTRDCQLCEEACIPYEDTTLGADCLPSNCGDVTFLGRCDGDAAEWCNRQGQLERRDCGSRGCGWIDDETGFYCR